MTILTVNRAAIRLPYNYTGGDFVFEEKSGIRGILFAPESDIGVTLNGGPHWELQGRIYTKGPITIFLIPLR